MPKITVDGREIEVAAGATIIVAIDQLGVAVPRYCYHPRLPIAGNCRMCLVEVEKMPKLVTSCTTPVTEGMVVHTTSPRVKESQANVLEFLLLNHPLDCPICDKAGECDLQNQYFQFSARDSRLDVDEKVHKPKAVDLGERIVLDAERCVLCTRCIRFMEVVAHDPVLGIRERADRSELTIFPGKRLDSRYSINTTDVCPVGALTSKEFRFRKRVWFLKHTKSVCPNCATGCPVMLDHEDGKIYRMMPGTRDGVETWLCDPGRLGFTHVNEAQRPKMPVMQSMEARGTQVISSWPDALARVAAGFREHADANSSKVGAIISNWHTNEEIYAFIKLMKAFGASHIALHDPKTGLVDSGPADDILIRDDKNPNTRGAREITGGIKNAVKPLAELLDACIAGKIKALYVCDPDLVARVSDPKDKKRVADALKKVKFLVVQSPIQSDLTRSAHVHLASATFAEKEGTFTNGDGVVQKVRRAFKLAGEILPDLEIFVRLADALGQPLGFKTPGQAMAALAAEVKVFADVKWNDLDVTPGRVGYGKLTNATPDAHKLGPFPAAAPAPAPAPSPASQSSPAATPPVKPVEAAR